VRPQAESLGLKDADTLVAMLSDIGLDGKEREVWLIVTKTQVAAITAPQPEPVAREGAPAPAPEPESVEPYEPLVGPFALKDVERARIFQTVGSGFFSNC